MAEPETRMHGPRPLALLIGMVAGVALGVLGRALLPEGEREPLMWITDNVAGPIGQIFLRGLFMLVVPLLFSGLVVGVCELDLKKLGKIGGRTIAYTVLASTVSVIIGLTLVTLFQPGAIASPGLREALANAETPPAAKAPSDTSAIGLLVSMVPDNPVRAAANGEMLPLIVFSLLFGIALSLTSTPASERLREMIQGLFDVSMTLILLVLKLAPLGVGALMFSLATRIGTDLFGLLFAYVATVLCALAIHMFGFYSLTIRVLGKRSPIDFFRSVRLAMLTAFSTASSNATLPTALRVAETELRLPRHVSRFVLTAGAAMNQNGTALFEGVTVLFLAQVFGVELTLPQQALVMGICILAGIGTAGVPAGSIPVIAMILTLIGVPTEGLGLILGVDRFLDMCRTTVNVTGDLAAAVVVARGETEPESLGDGTRVHAHDQRAEVGTEQG
jgi:DAACS family dicarboxylate/amino acid:cation (Na+ or H+) symporter